MDITYKSVIPGGLPQTQSVGTLVSVPPWSGYEDQGCVEALEEAAVHQREILTRLLEHLIREEKLTKQEVLQITGRDAWVQEGSVE